MGFSPQDCAASCPKGYYGQGEQSVGDLDATQNLLEVAFVGRIFCETSVLQKLHLW